MTCIAEGAPVEHSNDIFLPRSLDARVMRWLEDMPPVSAIGRATGREGDVAHPDIAPAAPLAGSDGPRRDSHLLRDVAASWRDLATSPLAVW